jgi:hypothetical protein
VERPTWHRYNVCNNPVHNVLCATLLSDNERDTRICNTCWSTMPKEKSENTTYLTRQSRKKVCPRRVRRQFSLHWVFYWKEKQKKEIGGSSSEKTSLEEKKEPKKLKSIEVHDFHIDDTNIDSQTSSSSSSLSSTSLVSFSNVGNSLRVRVSLQNLLTLQKLQPVRHIQLM